MAPSKQPAAEPGRRREFVQGLERGFAVIRAFSRDSATLTITDVAGRARLTRAVARRYLLTLKELGYIAQVDKGFLLTPRVLDLGSAYLVNQAVAGVAQPFMEEAVEALHESCSASVLDGRDVVYIARVPAKRIMSVNLAVGSRLPAHCTSMGKVLLAALSAEALAAFFDGPPLERRTGRTICEPKAFRKELEAIRARGWAFSNGESEDGVRTVAAPIVDRSGRVQAAINVSGHASRVSMKALRSVYLPVLLAAADGISRALGGDPARPYGRTVPR